MPKQRNFRRSEVFLAVDPGAIFDQPVLTLPGLPPPTVRPKATFDAELAIDALHLAAGQLVGLLYTLRLELERAPMPDADPERDRNAVSRVALLHHALAAAEASATTQRVELSALAPRLSEVERVQIEATATEAMLVLLERELARAPWDVSDGRIGLLGELLTSALVAARLVRSGLGAIAERIASV